MTSKYVNLFDYLNPIFDLYVPPTKVKHYQRAEFTDKDKQIFNEFFKQDVAIFNHFNKTFWRKVENYGNGSKVESEGSNN